MKMNALESVARETHAAADRSVEQCAAGLQAGLDARLDVLAACAQRVDAQLAALDALARVGERHSRVIARAAQKHESHVRAELLAAVQTRAELVSRRLLVLTTTLRLRAENERAEAD